MKYSKVALVFFLIALIVFLAMKSVVVSAQPAWPVVVLSPGHGWWNEASNQVDPGAAANDLLEKDVNLAVSLQVEQYLSRCPVEVHLTRTADDPDHALEDVDELVNAWNPTLGVSIHANSAGGNPSGTMAYYTTGGWDNQGSRELADALSRSVAEAANIDNQGIRPETASRHGSLYIRHWHAPSALIETGFMQGDAELLRDQPDLFGRAIALAILQHLEVPVACANWAEPVGLPVAVLLPGEAKSMEITFQNDGITDWAAKETRLVQTAGPNLGNSQQPLQADLAIGEQTTWIVDLQAPETPGVYTQTWQVQQADAILQGEVKVRVLVLQKGAQDLRQKIEQLIEQARLKGEEELERLLRNLEQQMTTWILQEVEQQANQCLAGMSIWIGLLAGMVLVPRLLFRN